MAGNMRHPPKREKTDHSKSIYVTNRGTSPMTELKLAKETCTTAQKIPPHR